MLDTWLLAVILVILLGGLIAVFRMLQNRGGGQNSESLALLQNQIQDQLRQVRELRESLEKKLDEKLTETNQAMRTQFGQSAKIIQDVTERLTKLDETNRQVVGFADQLQSLQDILKNPKQRGILGEYYLETLLKNVLPPGSYQMQYPFADGTIVDAVVFVKEKIIPIDSKFSIENYNRLVEEKDPLERERLEKAFKSDLKNRVDETAKYVKPAEGTMDFAFMFIPHEAIYYDLLVAQVGAVKVSTRDLIEYAFKERHVIIVSPTSFLAYLQTVLQGLNALKIEESAKEIRKNVELLGKHLVSYEDYMKKLGTHLGTTVNAYTAAAKEFKKVDKDVMKITGAELGLGELPALERPISEEE